MLCVWPLEEVEVAEILWLFFKVSNSLDVIVTI